MRRSNWEDAPLDILALKLCEEAGEVANVITDSWKERQKGKRGEEAIIKARRKLASEIAHVELMCRLLRQKADLPAA